MCDENLTNDKKRFIIKLAMTASVASFRRKVQATLCMWETGLPRTSLDV